MKHEKKQFQQLTKAVYSENIPERWVRENRGAGYDKEYRAHVDTRSRGKHGEYETGKWRQVENSAGVRVQTHLVRADWN